MSILPNFYANLTWDDIAYVTNLLCSYINFVDIETVSSLLIRLDALAWGVTRAAPGMARLKFCYASVLWILDKLMWLQSLKCNNIICDRICEKGSSIHIQFIELEKP